MKHLTAIFLLLAAASAFGQSVKTLGYNTTNGQVIYTGTNALHFTNPAVGFAKPPIFKVLTNDFAITNQTNMTVVAGLTITTEANKQYVVELVPLISSTIVSTDLQVVTTNASAFGTWTTVNASAINSFSTNLITSVARQSVGLYRAIPQRFYVVGGTNAGSVSLQFASSVETNVNTMHAGSFILAQEVSPQ